MNSMRLKLTLALLSMSFAAIAVIGIVSRTLALERFDRLVVGRSFTRFETEITDYYLSYGSWKEARNREDFIDFVRRTRPRSFLAACRT